MPVASRRGLVALCLLVCALPPIAVPVQAQSVQADPVVQALELFTMDPLARERAVATLVARGNPDAVPALIQALRFFRDDPNIAAALQTLTGADPGGWFDWMLWQQAHPEVAAFEGFDRFKAAVLASLDANFKLFVFPEVRHETQPRAAGHDCDPAFEGALS